jgi:hypothetical protein
MSDDELPPQPQLTTGLTASFHHAPLLSPLFSAASIPDASRRPHRRVSPPGAPALIPSVTYSTAVSAIRQQAVETVQEMAMRGELSVPSQVTEEQLEEMEVDESVLQEQVAQAKQRLSIKIQQLEAVAARVKLAKKMRAEQNKREKEQRQAALRQRRIALMRQQSEEVAAAAAPPTDLTTQGIEPNPSVYYTFHSAPGHKMHREVTHSFVCLFVLLFVCLLCAAVLVLTISLAASSFLLPLLPSSSTSMFLMQNSNPLRTVLPSPVCAVQTSLRSTACFCSAIV